MNFIWQTKQHTLITRTLLFSIGIMLSCNVLADNTNNKQKPEYATQEALDAEVAIRESADVELQDNIATEASERSAADSILQNQINLNTLPPQPEGQTQGLSLTLCPDGVVQWGACPPPYTRLVFITSSRYTGNLGGAAGADVICNTVAASAGLPGSYMAWVSDAVSSPNDRFIKSEGPYVLLDGRVIAIDYDDLIDGELLEQIELNEVGVYTTGYVWTATSTMGTYLDNEYQDGNNSCAGFTSEVGRAVHGLVGVPRVINWQWTRAGGIVCDYANKLYCFQQQ